MLGQLHTLLVSDTAGHWPLLSELGGDDELGGGDDELRGGGGSGSSAGGAEGAGGGAAGGGAAGGEGAGAAARRCTLCATVVGNEAWRVEAMSDADAARELLAALRAALGPAVHVPEPRAARLSRWGADERFRGAYSLLPVGAPRDIFAALQAPACEGRLWLAGEAVHARYSGYLQGAYLSGEEVGRRVAESLSV